MNCSNAKFALSGFRRLSKPLTRLSPLSVSLMFASAASAADDQSLTWNGITLYGVYDIGVGYQSHGAPLSQDWFVGVQYHPELKSKPFDPHPLFTSFIKAAVEQSRLV